MQSVTDARCAEAERSANQLRDENQALRQKLMLLQQEVCMNVECPQNPYYHALAKLLSNPKHGEHPLRPLALCSATQLGAVSDSLTESSRAENA